MAETAEPVDGVGAVSGAGSGVGSGVGSAGVAGPGAEGPGAEGPGAEDSRDGAGLAWVRVRLRAAPAAALATFALVLATAFLAAALPRAVDRYEDTALRHAVQDASPRDRGISLLASYEPDADPSSPGPLAPDAVDQVERDFRKLVRPPIRLSQDEAVYGVRTTAESEVPDPELPHTSPHNPGADLVAQAGLAAHTRVVAGRLPHAVPVADQPTALLEGAVTERTAKVLHLRIGQEVHLYGAGAQPLTVRVSGVVAPLDPDSVYWNEDADLLSPTLDRPPTPPGGEPKTYWHFTLLVDRTTAVSMPVLGVDTSLYWHHPLDVSRLAAHDVPALQEELSSLDTGPASVALRKADPGVRTEAGVGTVLDAFAKDRRAVAPMVLVAAVGVGTTALAVLLMAGGLAAERRRGEIALLRSRGGSLRGILRRLAGETAAAAVPGGLAGTALALALLPTERLLLPVCLGAAVTAVAALALPLRAAWAVRRPRPAEREDLVAARPSRRRLVAELTVTVLVVGTVLALRRRGTGDGGSDPFLAAAPVLVAVAAALVLLRVFPVPLRLLGRPAARLTGAVAHLGLARAGRAPATGQLPLLAMLVALTVASFGGSVLAGTDHGRDRAAVATVGADARIDAQGALARQLPGQVRKVPGVGQVVTARVEPNSANAVFGMPYSLVIVDPVAYAKLTRAIGLPSFPGSAFTGDDGHGPLPAVLSPKLAHALAGRTTLIDTGVGASDVRPVGVVATTPAAPGSEFVLVSAAQLNARHPEAAAFPQYTEPTTLLAMAAPGAKIDAKALHTVGAHSTAFATVLLRGEQRASMSDSPLQHGARGIYLAAVAAGAAYSALALLLSLLQAAPQRATLLARLRTMGMTRGQSRGLVLLEMLPQALLASVGGVLVGLAVVPLLGPGVDLRALTFGTGPRALAPVDFGLGLRADPWSLALPSAGLLILACVVLLAQVWVSGRRRESTELRAGDRV
ncbi:MULTISPECIES: ABC transporter permease [unclassified Streptomyces]|uniref:ABC transporter permease n=1 Tax=unclassified Streptomyces TaxID=2593676 RepID=UPI002E2AC588|nr:ABC transporter permease [Streptomyces sp. NBC_00223]